MTINDYMDLRKEFGLYERAAVESYINAMVHAVDDLMCNRKESRIDRRERALCYAMEPFCTSHGVRLNDLITVLDNEATRRIYVKNRLRKGVA